MSDPKTIPEINDNHFQPLEWPKIKWQAEMWLAIISFLFGFVLYFFPKLTEDLTSPQVRLMIGVPLLLAPILFPLLAWVWKTIGVAIRRVRFYPFLYIYAKQSVVDVGEFSKSYHDLVKKAADEKQFEIAKVGHVDGKLYIVVQKRRFPKVSLDDLLIVAHKEDGLIMGEFKVTEVRSKDIYAIGFRNVDALWLGYIRRVGELSMTPNLTAFYIQQEK
jgi:hypothetical protein